MGKFRKLLASTAENYFVSEWSFYSGDCDFGAGSPWSVRKYTLRGGMQEGVDVVEVDNGKFRFAVLPTRGMGIWKGRCGAVDLGWDSPVKDPVHPAHVNEPENGGLGWLKGFNEWIVRCGLSSHGAPALDPGRGNENGGPGVLLPLHGKIANIPARRVEVEVNAEGIVVRGQVDEVAMFGPSLRLDTEIRTDFESGAVTIDDTVSNLGRTPTEHQLLYHVNYGPPLLQNGSTFVAPVDEAGPRDPRAAEGMANYDRFGGPRPAFAEQAYYLRLRGRKQNQETLALLRDAKGVRGSALRFNLADFPCFTLWKNTASREEGYVTGLEPATGFPNPRPVERERGRVPLLPGRQSRKTSMRVEVLETEEAVRSVEAEIKALQGRAKPKIHPSPVPHLSGA